MTRYAKLFVTRGLPGSGKTTLARDLVNQFIDGFKVTRLNRDDFRTMMHGKRFGAGRQEQLVTAAQHAAILAVLSEGSDVIVDDTNLRDSQIRTFERLADQAGAEVVVIDLRDVGVEECVRRDSLRQGAACVGEDVIRRMHGDHIAKRNRSTAAVTAARRARRVTATV